MALGQVNIERKDVKLADLQMTLANLQLDSSYITGGSVGLAAKLGLNPEKVIMVSFIDPGPYHLSYSPGTDKLRVFQTGAAGALTEAGAASNQSGVTVRVWVLSQQ